MILIYCLCGSVCLYVLFTIYFTIGLHRLKIYKKKELLPTITIVVAARNEESNLQQLLKSLVKQDYPNEKMEIVIVSDRSTDGTWQIINDFSNLYPFVKGIKLEDINDDMTPKKHALTCGIKNSSGEIILSTDGDCLAPKGWASSMVSSFGDNTGIVVGRSSINLSKQSIYPGKEFGPYGIAKASSLFSMKQYALEFGKYNIRVNGINADRIKSGLLTDQFIKERAKARNMSSTEYLNNNLLQKQVTAEDVAEAFFAQLSFEKTTGNIITVDGGNIEASLR